MENVLGCLISKSVPDVHETGIEMPERGHRLAAVYDPSSLGADLQVLEYGRR
jgi:hypothetical protein